MPDGSHRGPVVLPELRLFERPVFRDTRGTFTELWREDAVREDAGLPRFVQDNAAHSRRGVIRGLHFQNPRPQGKLVSVMRGSVIDVAVDVRVGSPTFGRYVAVELSDENFRQLWVPRGFAHGFEVLSDTADFFYKCDAPYSPANEITIRWNDPDLGIKWQNSAPSLSARDASAPLLKDIEGLPRYERL